MSSLIPMAIGQELSNANYRNQGQSTGLLGGPGAIDGTAQSFWNQADPFNTTGHASSGHALANIFDPGNVMGLNQAANPYGAGGVPGSNGTSGTPSVLPTLPGVGGPQLYNPNSFSGYAKLGSDPYDLWASQAVGKMYVPTLIPQPRSAAPAPVSIGGKGVTQDAGYGGSGVPVMSIAPSVTTLKRAQ